MAPVKWEAPACARCRYLPPLGQYTFLQLALLTIVLITLAHVILFYIYPVVSELFLEQQIRFGKKLKHKSVLHSLVLKLIS